MRFENTIYLTIVLFLFACNSKSEKDILEDSSSESKSKSEIHQDLNHIDPIDDSRLVMDWVNEILSSNYLESQFIKSQDTVRNIHDRKQLDTINYFKTERSQVGIYVTPTKSLLLESNIYDSDISLSEQIKIGVNKAVVFDILNREFANDTLTIREPDGYRIYFELFFRDNILTRIHYESVLD